MTKITRQSLLLAVSSLLAGLVNGLLGAGGGIILVAALGKVSASLTNDRRDVFANALAVMLPLSAISLISYAARGSVDISLITPLLIPAAAGGLCGALILDKINARWLKMIFGVIVVWSGLTMLLG